MLSLQSGITAKELHFLIVDFWTQTVVVEIDTALNQYNVSRLG
jgi:hypothetical protein